MNERFPTLIGRNLQQLPAKSSVSQPLPNTALRYRAQKNARSGLERAQSIPGDCYESAHFLRLRSAVIQDLDALADTSINTVSVQAVLRQKKFGIAMSYETVGNAHAHDTHLVLKSVFLEQLQNRRTNTACEVCLFNCYQQPFGSRES